MSLYTDAYLTLLEMEVNGLIRRVPGYELDERIETLPEAEALIDEYLGEYEEDD